MTTNINFPIIVMGVANSLEIITTTAQLTHITTQAFRKETLNNATIYDSNNKCFVINRITKVGNLNPWWKFEFFNPMLKIELSIVSCPEFSLEFAKQRIVSSINQFTNYWDSSDNINNIVQFINNATSLSEIINYLKKRRGIN